MIEDAEDTEDWWKFYERMQQVPIMSSSSGEEALLMCIIMREGQKGLKRKRNERR